MYDACAVGRHLTGLTTLCRGSEVRKKRLSDMSEMEYPVQSRMLPGRVKAGKSYSMQCLAFTNTMGKSNPGDRVDMDVSAMTGL